jgi:hypothetical protein
MNDVLTVRIEALLTGGNPRSLGNTGLVVDWVLHHPECVGELFDCLFSVDAIVRMRAGDALEKVCSRQPGLLQPYVPRLLGEVARIRQPSVQWHLAQMLTEVTLTPAQRAQAIVILQRNLAVFGDWILTNLTVQALAEFARQDAALRPELARLLRRYTGSRRRSVASRATKLLAELERPVG